MVKRRTPGAPLEADQLQSCGIEIGNLESLQDIFLSPPKFVVGTTVSEGVSLAKTPSTALGRPGSCPRDWKSKAGSEEGPSDWDHLPIGCEPGDGPSA